MGVSKELDQTRQIRSKLLNLVLEGEVDRAFSSPSRHPMIPSVKYTPTLPKEKGPCGGASFPLMLVSVSGDEHPGGQRAMACEVSVPWLGPSYDVPSSV